MMLVERDEHVAFLDRLLAHCREGNGNAVLIEGSAAHGKTELLKTFTEHAVDAGSLFLGATCSRVESILPLGVLSQLFHTVEMPSEISEQVAVLLDDGTSIAMSRDNAAEAAQSAMVNVFHGLFLLLLELAKGNSVLIGVDDVQHADVTSLHCLLYLVRRIRSARVLVVFTESTRLPSVRSLLDTELRHLPHCHRINLTSLSKAGVESLLTKHYDGKQAAELSDSCYAASGGNPMLVQALLEDRRTANAGPGRNYGWAVVNCLHRCESTLLNVARGLAILGADASAAELDELVGAGGAEVTAMGMDLLAAAGLLDGRAFRHPAGARAVLEDIPPKDRASLHRRAAQLLHARGAPAIAVARHLVSADHITDPWVTAILVEGADQALLADELTLAVECLGLARRTLPNGKRKTAVHAKLARAEWQINPSAAQRHFTPLVEAMRSNQLEPCDAIALLRQMLWHGQITEATEVLNWLRNLNPDDHNQATAEIRDVELWIACVYPPLGRRHHIPRKPVNDNSVVLLTTDSWLHSTAALAEGLTGGDHYNAAHRAERFLREVHLSHAVPWAEEPALHALFTLIYSGRTSTAASWCTRLLNDATTRKVSTWQATFSAVRSEISLREGDLRWAIQHAQAAMTYMSPTAWGAALGFPLGCLIMAATRKGNYDIAAKQVAELVPEAMFQSRYGLHYLHARGHYYLATDRHHAALADFLSCGEFMRRWGLDMYGFVPWRTSAAEAWLCLNNRDQAKRLIFDQLARLGTESSRTRGISLRLLAAVSQMSRRPQLLTEAVDIFESCRDRFELARALAELGHAYRALGKHKRARMMLRRAWHVAKTCDATPLCRALLQEPTTLDLAIPHSESSAGIDALTEAERRVAALAVAGYINREIANKLFITPSTVEQHLTRVYRKLNVKDRRDLPTDLHTDMATLA